MKGFITVVATLLSLIVTAGVALGCVLVLAGPHSDILPSWLQGVVFVFGWAAVIAVPITVGRFTWRRLHQAGVAQQAYMDSSRKSAGEVIR